MPQDFTPMLAAHDAVRRDLIRFVTLLGGTAPITAERAGALARMWELVVDRVVENERLEGDLLWPAARLSVPVPEQGPLDVMAGLHERLLGLLDVATARFTPTAAADGAERGPLADAIERAAVLADKQFGYEERTVFGLLSSYLPAADWAAFVSSLHAPSGPLVDPVLLPWLLEGSRPDRVSTVLGLLAEDHRTAYEQEWKPAHRLRTAQVW